MGLGECSLILAFTFAIIICLLLLIFAFKLFCFKVVDHLTFWNQVIPLGIELASPRLIG